MPQQTTMYHIHIDPQQHGFHEGKITQLLLYLILRDKWSISFDMREELI